MVLTLHSEGKFNSAHHLVGYSGNCLNTHGHSWMFQIWVRGQKEQLDNIGILFDFKNIKTVEKLLDHTDLNVTLNFNPTCENITFWIFETFKKMREDLSFFVRVYESDKNYVELGDFNPFYR